jgi:hypothetical protein
MAAGVVDQLELVEVDVQHRVACLLADARLQRRLQAVRRIRGG